MSANPLSFIFKEYPVAVETGTFIGTTTFEFAKFFKQVHTIELDQGLFNQASKFLYTNTKNVSCYHGDSANVLKTQLINKLNKKHEKVFFYLDAHWSGDDSVDWQNSEWKGVSSWARGRNTAHRGTGDNPTSQEQNPLEDEIMHIYNLFKGECTIAIDDWDKIGDNGVGLRNKSFAGEDWSHINYKKIINNISDRLSCNPAVLEGHPPNFPKNEQNDELGTTLFLKFNAKS